MTTTAPQGSTQGSNILNKLLDRLMTGLLNGPAMNCRPHNSRQRVDVASLAKLEGVEPTELLKMLLGEDGSTKIVAKTPKAVARKKKAPAAPTTTTDAPPTTNKPDDTQLDVSQLLTKLRAMTEDARVYTQDTGVHALALGFPLLTMPPGTLGKEMSRRVIAPIAFIPVDITVTRGVNTTVEISCFGEGVDRVVPNVALFAWLEQLTGKRDLMRAFEDESGTKPLREILLLVAAAAKSLEIALPDFVPPGHEQMPADKAPDFQLPPTFKLDVAPRTDADKDKAQILPSAVLGLFPMANQGLIEDMKSFVEDGPVAGPMESFLTANLALDAVHSPPPLPGKTLDPNLPKIGPTSVRLVTDADPCQRQVVRMAQSTRGVVIHGPPGTGKSQTIVNLIGDHLSRGQRVLFVCDKRTALDVVLNRLAFNGLGDLCAVVHDPQTDQREFYRTVRDQLDGLQEKKVSPRSETLLAQLDEELNKLHSELLTYHNALSKPPTPDGESFHELVGKWFSIPASKVELPPQLAGITADSLGAQATRLQELFDRGTVVRYATNAWAGLATTDLSSFMSRPVSDVRSAATMLADAIAKSDATLVTGAPAFLDSIDVNVQAADRFEFSTQLRGIQSSGSQDFLPHLLALDSSSLTRLQARLFEASPMLDRVKASPLDSAMSVTAKSLNLTPPELNRKVQALQDYIESTKRLLGGLSFGTKGAAKDILSPFGLPLDAASAIKLKLFLEAFRDRVLLAFTAKELTSLSPERGGEGTDSALIQTIGGYLAISNLLSSVDKKPSLTPFKDAIFAQLKTADGQTALAAAFASAKERAASITATLNVAAQSQLIGATGATKLKSLLYANQPLAERSKQMLDQLDTLEGVVRIEKSLADMQPATASAFRSLMVSGVDARGALLAIQRNAIEAEIRKRIAADPSLQQVDPQRLQTLADRLKTMEKDRQQMIRDGVVQYWINKAQTRLVSSNKLNAVGADLKRRFLLTGKNAMRLRKVIQLGNAIEGGDPLFDLRPVWMASPETVAQLFARKPMFDVVIFDEASQCRLEEALPVLARAKRIVIAGDEKQLPPTRFFESAVGDGDEDREVQTSQDLFEKAQVATEDLLGAALQLQIQEAYLDVHYRSKNADLIEFSNQHFYGSRLQAIPTHPAKMPTVPPIILTRADGIYRAGENEKEALAVVELVKKLLAQPKPPSIGIACMNVQQRDMILDALDDAAEEDGAFAKQLDTARARTGSGSFEGLFVKNLENVQGDERDHMVISTTYGPDANGKFFQRFGPLQMQGGGRRLNVLVTRAREAVHLITSIPAGSYRSLPPAPEGSTPTGGWLLYAYLKYAEDLSAKYTSASRLATQTHSETDRPRSDRERVGDAPSLTSAPSLVENQNQTLKPTVTIMEKQAVSPLASAIASNILAAESIGGVVNWGNEGFCVDYAMAKKADPSQIGIGVLVDGTRFSAVDDPIAWDIFRVDIHQKQGWTLQRIWSPHFFRDPESNLRRIVASNA